VHEICSSTDWLDVDDDLSAEAQQPKKVPQIRYLFFNTSHSAATFRVEAFRQGLRELEYVEGKNIVIESRYSEGKLDRLLGLVAELVRLKVEVIVTSGLSLPTFPSNSRPSSSW
jgi:putative tryptophan/tyrosine transport system substrate-binding protein